MHVLTLIFQWSSLTLNEQYMILFADCLFISIMSLTIDCTPALIVRLYS